jgi:hypothetical protein
MTGAAFSTVKKAFSNIAFTQLASVVASLAFLGFVYPAPRFGEIRFVGASTPFLIWIPPLVVYCVMLKSRLTTSRLILTVAAGLIGSVAIAAAYGGLLEMLRRAEIRDALADFEQCRQSGTRSCIGVTPIDPPPPPYNWAWAAVAYAVAMVVLYSLLYWVNRRAMRSEPRYAAEPTGAPKILD